jgi:hypothetical protein
MMYRTFTKLTRAAEQWLKDEALANLNLYNIVIPFNLLFSNEYMLNLYQQINHRDPSDIEIDSMQNLMH